MEEGNGEEPIGETEKRGRAAESGATDEKAKGAEPDDVRCAGRVFRLRAAGGGDSGAVVYGGVSDYRVRRGIDPDGGVGGDQLDGRREGAARVDAAH